MTDDKQTLHMNETLNMEVIDTPVMVITPSKTVQHIYTEEELEFLTVHQLTELAASEFGLQFPPRCKKQNIIFDIIEEQTNEQSSFLSK